MEPVETQEKSSTKVTIWIRELRAPFFTATLVPVLLGASIAWYRLGVFYITFFALTTVAALCLHAGTNMINDYFDYKSGCDFHPIYHEFWAPFFGGSRLLPEGLLKPNDVYIAALLSYGLGATIGVFLALETGWILVLLGIIGVFSGYLYVTHLSPRGVGEFFVFLNFGPLMVLGSYYVHTQTFTLEPIIASIPVGLLIANVLWINEIPDYIADRAVGKNTLVVRLGRKRAADVYAAITVATYLYIMSAVGLRLMPMLSLITLATVPMTSRAIRVARAHYDEPPGMVRANAATIKVHLFTGLLLICAYALSGFLVL